MKTKTTSRIPILLSAFVCPGAGQFVQKRRAAGIIFAGGFILGFVWLMFRTVKIVISFYRMAFDSNYIPETPNITALLTPTIIAVIFYLISLFDVTIAQIRAGTPQPPDKTDVLAPEDHRKNPQ